MRLVLPLLSAVAVIGCAAVEQDTSEATYAPVEEASAPTVSQLRTKGFVEVDRNAVGCEIPGQPEVICDGFDAVFFDEKGKFGANDVAIERHEYDRYAYVCPAMDAEMTEWKCRKQEQTNG